MDDLANSDWWNTDEASPLAIRETPELRSRRGPASINFQYPGELTNEDPIILGDKASAGLSIEGHYSKEDGIVACLLAAKTDAADRAPVYGRSGVTNAVARFTEMSISKGLGGAA